VAADGLFKEAKASFAEASKCFIDSRLNKTGIARLGSLLGGPVEIAPAKITVKGSLPMWDLHMLILERLSLVGFYPSICWFYADDHLWTWSNLAQQGSTSGATNRCKVAIAALEVVSDENLSSKCKKAWKDFSRSYWKYWLRSIHSEARAWVKAFLNAVVIMILRESSTAWNIWRALRVNGLLAKPITVILSDCTAASDEPKSSFKNGC